MNPDLDTLRHFRATTALLIEFMAGQTRQSFESDSMRRYAVMYTLVILGEGVKRLSADFRATHPEVPWSRIAGTRDRIVHHYDEVLPDILWDVTQAHAPRLLTEIDRILAEEIQS